MPASSMPMPLTLTIPWIWRKSMALGLRREPCWTTTPSLMVLIPSTRVRIAKEGNSAQNSLPGRNVYAQRPVPGEIPNQLALAIRPASITPNAAATAHPARMLMKGATNLQRPLARSITITETSKVGACDGRAGECRSIRGKVPDGIEGDG